MAPRGAEPRPNQHYEEIDRQNLTQPRRDPYDYPTHSRSGPNHYHDAPGAGHTGRLPDTQLSPQSQQPLSNPRYYPSSQTGQQHRAALRQDVPPSPTMGHRGRQYYDSGGRRDGYRQASPGRYTSPERYPADRERYNTPDRYGDERQPDPRRKNPAIGAV